MMGIAAPTSERGGCRKNGGEIGGKTKGGSNDAFTFQNYFNSCPCRSMAWRATSMGQYFLRLIGRTCSAFSPKTNSYAIVVMSCPRSQGNFSLATPLIGISKLESAPATGVNGTVQYYSRTLPI